jgi:hypothetical protein
MAGYDAKKVSVVADGVTLVSFSEGTVVTCERNEDRVTPYIGAKGEADFAVSNNNSGTITLPLQQRSPSNRKLQQLAESRQEFPISVIDANEGGFRVGGNRAIILKEPPLERGSELADREWEIYVLDYSQVEV